MKLVKSFVATALLMFALGVSTYAGDLETPGCTTTSPVHTASVATDGTTLANPGSVTVLAPSALVVETENTMLLNVLITALLVF